MIDLLSVVAPVALLVGIGAAAWRSDIRNWNGGICIYNGLRWERFDTDSQGARGYKAGEYVMWISWPFVDR